MTYLLDANVLIALALKTHIHHHQATTWFRSLNKSDAWATCPLTENASVRIMGNPNFVELEGDTNDIRLLLQTMTTWPGHQFWPDSLTVRDAAPFPKLPGCKKLTDIYLHALAIQNSGALATLDARIDPLFLSTKGTGFFLIP